MFYWVLVDVVYCGFVAGHCRDPKHDGSQVCPGQSSRTVQVGSVRLPDLVMLPTGDQKAFIKMVHFSVA